MPLVHHVHGHTAVEVGRGWRAWLSAKSEKRSLAGASAVIAVSPTSAKYINAWGVPQERIHLVPNGVPARKKFIDRPVPAVWNLGAVAFFRPRKGLEVLLESISLLRRQGLPVQLRVIGGFDTPAYQNEVRQLAEKLGIAQFVEWRGFCQDVDAELDALDLLVLPSILPEGMPMVLLEALAAGVPPMGSRVDGITDVIEHGRNGLLFEPGSAEAIAESVSMVISGQHDWRQLRRNAIRSHARAIFRSRDGTRCRGYLSKGFGNRWPRLVPTARRRPSNCSACRSMPCGCRRPSSGCSVGCAERDGQCRYVVTPNVDHAVMFQEQQALRQAYADAALVLADGFPVFVAARMLGRPIPERVPGSDLVPALFTAVNSTFVKRLRVFLLGAAPGVADRAAQNIQIALAGCAGGWHV